MGKKIFKAGPLAKLFKVDFVEQQERAQKAAERAGSAAVEAPDTTPTAVSDDTLAAREAQRKRQLAAAGLAGTNLTGSMGLAGGANTSLKSLLGS